MSGSRSGVVVELVDIVRSLHEVLTEALCASVWKRVRNHERARAWTLFMLGKFWLGVIVRSPRSLTMAVQETSRRMDGAWPEVTTTAQALFLRCQRLHWRFFDELFHAFVARLLPQAAPVFARPLAGLRKHFPEILVLDGSKLDPIERRLKKLRDVRAVPLPGAIVVAYDLFRGIPRKLRFDPDAARAEIERARDVLGDLVRGALVVADRLYAVPAFFSDLDRHGLFGLFRRRRGVKLKKLRLLRDAQNKQIRIQDWIVRAGVGENSRELRWIRIQIGLHVIQYLTNVMDPEKLAAADAVVLYRHRWTVERLFFDLKRVLELHDFYAANPNAVAMQVYATAMVYAAMRVAQGQVAQQNNLAPEEISPAKLFPRLKRASDWYAGHDFAHIHQINPTAVGRGPTSTRAIHRCRGVAASTAQLDDLRVEKRTGRRRKRRFCRSRREWIALPQSVRQWS